MERTVFVEYEKKNDVILPERYIKALIDCNDDPEKICKDYGDASLFSFQEFVEAQEYLEMKKWCPDHVAIGNTGGGDVLVMKQLRNENTLLIIEAGALLPQYLEPPFCRVLPDFEDWLNRGCPIEDIDSLEQSGEI